MTRSEITTLLANYVGANNNANTRLDLVRERLLKPINGRGSKVPLLLGIYTDWNGDSIVTLPRAYNTILAGVAMPAASTNTAICGGTPLGVRNGWYEVMPDGTGLASGCSADGFIEQNGRYCTFQDWTTPKLLRFKFEVSESVSTILIRGRNAGSEVYTTYSATWIQGERVVVSGTTTVTTSNQFDALNLYVVKPVTNGRVSMYSVDGSGTEVLVALFDPSETVPKWRRYKVPNITDPSSNQFLAICKVEYTPLANDNDECIPSNLGALKDGFQALLAEDSLDRTRAKDLWASAREKLIEEQIDDVGSGAQGSVQVRDDFYLAMLGDDGYGGGWDSYGYWGG